MEPKSSIVPRYSAYNVESMGTFGRPAKKSLPSTVNSPTSSKLFLMAEQIHVMLPSKTTAISMWTIPPELYSLVRSSVIKTVLRRVHNLVHQPRKCMKTNPPSHSKNARDLRERALEFSHQLRRQERVTKVILSHSVRPSTLSQ
jgi:hypothetical protein